MCALMKPIFISYIFTIAYICTASFLLRSYHPKGNCATNIYLSPPPPSHRNPLNYFGSEICAVSHRDSSASIYFIYTVCGIRKKKFKNYKYQWNWSLPTQQNTYKANSKRILNRRLWAWGPDTGKKSGGGDVKRNLIACTSYLIYIWDISTVFKIIKFGTTPVLYFRNKNFAIIPAKLALSCKFIFAHWSFLKKKSCYLYMWSLNPPHLSAKLDII
jgi:hypothetical protein